MRRGVNWSKGACSGEGRAVRRRRRWRSALGGCLGYDGEVTHGYVIDEQALSQVKTGVVGRAGAGRSRHALDDLHGRRRRLVLYRPECTDPASPSCRSKVVDQHVLAIYFDKNGKVERIANYGLKDGKVFDFVSRTTPTGGAEPILPQGRDVNQPAARQRPHAVRGATASNKTKRAGLLPPFS